MLSPEMQNALAETTKVVAYAKVLGVDGFMKTLLAKPGEDLSEILARYTTRPIKNFLIVGSQSQQMIAEAGIVAQAVPLRTIAPLIEGSANEDAPDMQLLWAALLANAATAGAGIPPLYPRILSNLSPDIAEVLNRFHRLNAAGERRNRVRARVEDGPGTGRYTPAEIARPLSDPQIPAYEKGEAGVALAISELMALGLVEIAPKDPPPAIDSIAPRRLADKRGEIEMHNRRPVEYRLSTMGRAFVKACHPPGALVTGKPGQPTQG